jgi:hypothetical protein
VYGTRKPRRQARVPRACLAGDVTVDRIIDRAMALLEPVERYRLLFHDPLRAIRH